MTGVLQPADSAATTRTYRASARPWWQRLFLNREAAVIAALVAVILYANQNVLFFDNRITMTYLILDLAPILLIALPMTLVIITGEIDLSVASIVGLSSVTVGVLYDKGLPIVVAMFLALVVGLVCGALNGFLVTVLGLPSLAVTIGTLALYRGVAVGLLGTKAITEFPDRWTDLAKEKYAETGVPVIVFPFIVLAILFIVLLHFTSFGRGVYAIGQSREAARFSGIDVNRTKLVLFMLSGVVSAFAGIYYTLRFGSARGDNANGMELQVVAAVLLGGVSIFGGRGALPGVIAGVLLIGVIGSALRLSDYTDDIIRVVTGVLLIVSVVASSALAWVSSRRRKPKAGDLAVASPLPPETGPSGPTQGTPSAERSSNAGPREDGEP